MGVTNKRTLTKTRRKTRDVDQIKADIRSPAHLNRFQKTKAAEDLPGLGQFYCVACSKWFETDSALVGHRRGKPHKRRLRQLRDTPYTQQEAEAAAGIGRWTAPVTEKKETVAHAETTEESSGDKMAEIIMS